MDAYSTGQHIASSTTRTKYGMQWHADTADLQIELAMIANGGYFTVNGVKYGNGLFEHYMEARKLCWPDRYRHRWTDLMYQEFINNDITILMGPASCGKTATAAEYALLNYWARPHNTLIILSTVTADKLDTGIFGEVKMLWGQARNRWDFLAGNLLEHRRAITTDSLDEDKMRDMRRGIIGRACYVGKSWVGLGVLQGTKQDYVYYLCDEIQYMAATFSATWNTLFSNGAVKIIGAGNPKHDPDDQLGITAEPIDGWNSLPEPDKTTCWDTRFMNARCVNLVGTDSPNFDVPENAPVPYPKLIARSYINRLIHNNGPNSPDLYTFGKGVMKLGLSDERVITRQLCREHNAHDKALWSGSPLTRVHALDPSYSGGGDDCISMVLEFGEGLEGLTIVRIVMCRKIHIDAKKDMSAEAQVVAGVAEDLKKHGIPNKQSFYDPYGKGTIGAAYAELFGRDCPVPIDSGGKPTRRPVREGLMVDDPVKGKRLKRCDEHYSKFVTEAWFSVRYTIQAGQMRELPHDVMLEGCLRKHEKVAGNKIEVESKEDYKERVGKSPNKFDTLAIGIEGCRQSGFVISKLGPATESEDEDDYFDEESKRWKDAIKARMLTHK